MQAHKPFQIDARMDANTDSFALSSHKQRKTGHKTRSQRLPDRSPDNRPYTRRSPPGYERRRRWRFWYGKHGADNLIPISWRWCVDLAAFRTLKPFHLPSFGFLLEGLRVVGFRSDGYGVTHRRALVALLPVVRVLYPCCGAEEWRSVVIGSGFGFVACDCVRPRRQAHGEGEASAQLVRELPAEGFLQGERLGHHTVAAAAQEGQRGHGVHSRRH